MKRDDYINWIDNNIKKDDLILPGSRRGSMKKI